MNFIIKTVWLGLSGGFMWSLSRIITDNWFLSIPLFLVMWIVCIFVGFGILGLIKPDPDTKAANSLGIPINRYRMYERLYNEHMDLMMKHGTNSIEANDFFKREVIPYIKNNPNEWRRFQNSRQKSIYQMMQEEGYV